MRNLWTRALGGVTGIAAMDIIWNRQKSGLVKLSFLEDWRTYKHPGVALCRGGILGFVIHMLIGVLWALIFALAVRKFRSRHNVAR